MEGPGTRDAPRGWRPRWWRSYRQKKVRGSRVPGSVLCGSARTAALFHRLGAIKLPTSGPACSGPVPVGAPRLVNAEAFHARLHPSRAVELRDCPPCGMDACSISQVWRWRTQRSEIGRTDPCKLLRSFGATARTCVQNRLDLATTGRSSGYQETENSRRQRFRRCPALAKGDIPN